MAKLKNPLFGFNARGSLRKLVSFRQRGQQTIAENIPSHPDARTSAQLEHRTMFQMCTNLWHTLSDTEKATWESIARPFHMTGYAYYQSQCLRPNPGIYLPLLGGTMQGNIDMATKRVLNLPAPVADEEPSRKTDLASHEANDVHTLAQIPQSHANEKHTSTFITQAAVETHAGLTGGIHGVAIPLSIGNKLSPRCSIYRATSPQSIPNLVNTKIQYNAELYDIFEEWSTVNYRFKPTLPGWYLMTGCCQIELNTDGTEGSHKLFRNGAEIALFDVMLGAAAYAILGVFYLAYFDGVADYAEFYAWNNSGAARNLTASASRNFMQIFLLGKM